MRRSSAPSRRSRSRKCRGAATTRPSALPVARDAVEDADRLVDMPLLRNERRQQPDHIVAGGGRDHAGGAELVADLGVRHFAAEPRKQSLAADLDIDAGMLGDETLELAVKITADAPHLLEELRLQHDIEHGVPEGHGERIAAEGRAVAP